MALSPGTRIGSYEIAEQIGAGGMGEVYRATDGKLGRQVALKVLPDAFVEDSDRLARFEREARTLASLNHPGIAHLYGLEDAGSVKAIAMELVEGPTLADRIAGGPMPVRESLELALQIAEALEAAHEKGVVHRDLKPANIKVTPDGTVKVLDFGLAKAFVGEGTEAANLSQSPTLSIAATQAGVILGTAAYMSPEQAKGLPADRRADVFSFGCVLYEMLTGRMPFQGELATEILASVINQEPDYSAIGHDLNPRIDELLRRCFEKSPRNRWQSIGDVRVEIERILQNPLRSEPASDAAGSRSRAPTWPVAVGVLLVVAAIAGIGGRMLAPEPARDVYRIPVSVTEGLPSVFSPDMVALAPDGTLVYAGGDRLYRRALGEFTSRPVEGTDGGTSPFVSPDGAWIGFDDGQDSLWKVPSSGGGAVAVCADCERGLIGATWGAGDRIVFGSYLGTLWEVSANGGEPRAVSTLAAGETAHIYPEFLPGGEMVLFTIWRGSIEGSEIGILSLETGQHRVLGAGVHPRYASSGHLVFARAGGLWAVGFDPDRGEITGDPRRVLESVSVDAFIGAAVFALSTNGTLAYKAGLGTVAAELTWFDREGHALGTVGDPAPYAQFMLSPDEDRVAVDVLNTQTGSFNIRVLDLATGIPTNVTSGNDNDRDPVWSPDGRAVAFTRSRAGGGDIFQRLLGDASPPTLVHATDVRIVPEDWFGDSLLYLTDAAEVELYSVSLTSGDVTSIPTPSGVLKDEPHPSPDGEWLAYEMEQGGIRQIFVARFPGMSGNRPVSRSGGVQPRWRGDGRELYFLSPEGDMMRVPLPGGPAEAAGQPEVMFPTGLDVVPGIDQFDVTSDGERFLLLLSTPEGRAESREIKVVVNWLEELKSLVPTD